jgi:ADP-ribosylglycohydrolase
MTREFRMLEDRAVGSLVGAAVGDALGFATEEHTTEDIKERYGGWVEDIVEPFYPDWQTARAHAPYHNGDGVISDDTVMTQILIKTYLAKRDHLDAFDVDRYMVPLMRTPTYIPYVEKVTLPELVVWLPEKYMTLRLKFGNVDPREAGVGNTVNCGAAMYMPPVGIINAASPQAAYAEAIEITGAHQCSFGREAAGVFAAAVAEAVRPGASVVSVVEVALNLAKDGTREAIQAVCDAASACRHWKSALPVLRQAVTPYDTMEDDYLTYGRDSRRPSRSKSIEELPVALGLLLLADGDYQDSVLGGVNYGRDADSIASMAGALAGALGGLRAIPARWHETVARVSKTELIQPAKDLAALALDIYARDEARLTQRREAMKVLGA